MKVGLPVRRRPPVTAPCRASVTATNGAMNTEPSRRSHPNAPASPRGRLRAPSTAAVKSGCPAWVSRPTVRSSRNPPQASTFLTGCKHKSGMLRPRGPMTSAVPQILRVGVHLSR